MSESEVDGDIVHFHNRFFDIEGKQLIQYHSEPSKAEHEYSHKKIVLAQYHATLPEYQGCHKVRNVINFETELYKPRYARNIKIGFSPSITKTENEYYTKAYSETKEVLKKIKERCGIKYDIITGVPLDECIKRKSRCSIIIDECATGSYHRSGLEGLALGKLTICSMSPEVENILKWSSGSNTNPFENIWIDDLYDSLLGIITKGLDYIIKKGKQNRAWMQEFWHPKNIIKEYIKIYEEL